MIAHIDLWFAWIRQKGLKADRMEDIILVTGTDVTRSWANVAFLGGQADARVSSMLKWSNLESTGNSHPSAKLGLCGLGDPVRRYDRTTFFMNEC
jgi:hypothetical protein